MRDSPSTKLPIVPVTVAGSDVIGAVESSTKVEPATVTAALARALRAGPRRGARLNRVPPVAGTLCSTQLVEVGAMQSASTVCAAFEVS